MRLTNILFVLALVACTFAISDNSRIATGKAAHTGQFPWMASIHFDDQYVCGGTLIFNRWVLTSAGCVAQYIGTPRRLTVLLGGLSMANEPEPGRTEYNVDAVYHHYAYVPGEYYHYNLGLLNLAKNAAGTNIATATILATNTSIPAAYPGNFAGWGGTTNAATTSMLQFAPLTAITPAECGAQLGEVLSDAHTCTNSYPAPSPCWFDHGGAFVGYYDGGSAFIVGVAAYPGCTEANRPSVFINPAYWENRAWISAITGEN